MDRAPIELRTDVVERPGDATRLLVLVHGYREPPANLTDRMDLIDPEGRWLAVVPHAPFLHRDEAIWNRSWFTHPDEAIEQFTTSLRSMDALLGRLERETGLRAADAVVGGFSQGGGLGISTLMSADVVNRPAAAFGICSFPTPCPGFRVDLRTIAGRPCFLSGARSDHFAPIESIRAGAAFLRETGVELTYVETDSGHVVTDEAATAAGAWLDAVADGRPAPAVPDLLAGADARDTWYDDLWEFVG